MVHRHVVATNTHSKSRLISGRVEDTSWRKHDAATRLLCRRRLPRQRWVCERANKHPRRSAHYSEGRGKAARTFAPVPFAPSFSSLIPLLLRRLELLAAEAPRKNGLGSLKCGGKGAQVPLLLRSHVGFGLPWILARSGIDLTEGTLVGRLAHQVDAAVPKGLLVSLCRRLVGQLASQNDAVGPPASTRP